MVEGVEGGLDLVDDEEVDLDVVDGAHEAAALPLDQGALLVDRGVLEDFADAEDVLVDLRAEREDGELGLVGLGREQGGGAF